jgi:tetratricopeptide (TPR) repeat protein
LQLEESLTIYRELGDKNGIVITLNNLGMTLKGQGDYAKAQSLYEQSLAIVRKLKDTDGSADSPNYSRNIAGILNNLGLVASDQGDDVAARRLHEESLAI